MQRITRSALLLLVASACGRTPAASGDVVLSRLQPAPCPGRIGKVKQVEPTLSEAQACSLLAIAWDEIGSADSFTAGQVGAADTLAVIAARIDRMDQHSISDSVLTSWWVVTLSLEDRPYDAEVRFNRETGVAELRSTHKPIGSGVE